MGKPTGHGPEATWCEPFLLPVLLALALPAVASASDQVKTVESLTSGQTVSDGVRYVSWTHGTDVRVLDDQTGTVASFPLPAGCGAPGRWPTASRRRSAAAPASNCWMSPQGPGPRSRCHRRRARCWAGACARRRRRPPLGVDHGRDQPRLPAGPAAWVKRSTGELVGPGPPATATSTRTSTHPSCGRPSALRCSAPATRTAARPASWPEADRPPRA